MKWDVVRLGEVCIEDKTIFAGDKQSRPYLGLEMIEAQTGRIDWGANTNEGVSTCFAFDTRHVLYGKLRPYLNKVALPDLQGRCTTEIIPLLPNPDACRKYIAYVLRRKETIDYVMPENTGSRMPRADMGHLLNMQIPFPPIDEQRRIAADIESRLAVVEKAKRAAEKQLDAARGLKSAFWRETFKENDWEKVRVGDVCETNIYNVPANKKGEMIYIDISSIDNIAKKIVTPNTIPIIGAPSRAKQLLKPNDVIISTVRPNLNAIAVNEIISDTPVVASTGFCVLRCQKNLNYRYLFYYCTTNDFVKNLTDLAKGSSYPAVTNSDVFSQTIHLPPLDDQRRIVEQVEKQYAASDSMMATLQRQIDAINALPAAILRQAFFGKSEKEI